MNAKNLSVLGALLVALFAGGCINPGQLPTNATLYSCTKDSDCVPKPGCHPHECINKAYEDYFPKPEVCTMMFDCQAAYSAADCACTAGQCVNRNALRANCGQFGAP